MTKMMKTHTDFFIKFILFLLFIYYSFYVEINQGYPCSSLLFKTFVNNLIENINSDLYDILETSELKYFLLLFADEQVVF